MLLLVSYHNTPHMRKIIIIALAIVLAGTVKASDTLIRVIPEAKIRIDLPNNSWHMTSKETNNGVTVYFFKRDPITDSLKRKIIPNIGIIVEKVDEKTDVVTWSVVKRANMPLEVDKMFIHGDGLITFKNAVGYKGRYTDGLEHTIYVIHAINNNMGIQLIFDSTTSVFDQVDKEFQEVMKSFKKA